MSIDPTIAETVTYVVITILGAVAIYLRQNRRDIADKEVLGRDIEMYINAFQALLKVRDQRQKLSADGEMSDEDKIAVYDTLSPVLDFVDNNKSFDTNRSGSS